MYEYEPYAGCAFLTLHRTQLMSHGRMLAVRISSARLVAIPRTG